MNTHLYRKVSIIKYNNKRFQVFMDEKNRYAFLELDENNKFHYPKIEDFIGLGNIFSENLDKKAFFRKNKMNKFTFTASVLAAAGIISCSSILFNELKNENIFTADNVTEVISVSDDYKDEKEIIIDNQSYVIDNEEIKEENQKIQEITEEDSYVAPTVTEDMYGIFDSQIDIYNSIALNKFLGEKHVTLETINESINNNNNINQDIKDVLKDFSQRILNEYPNIDMRLFYENINRLRIVYESSEELNKTGNIAYFDYKDGTIHINQNINLAEGSFDLMVLRHEIGHMISLGILKDSNGKDVVVMTNNGAYGNYLREAIDVIITSTPYKDEYSFNDFGYNINTNELEAVIEAIPNFDMSILANQDVYNIADYLNEINPNEITASRFIDLMDMQTISYYNFEDIELDYNDIKDVYKYIANTYVNYVLNENMTYDEIQEVESNLKATLSKNINYTYQLVGIEEIDNTFNDYMITYNISSEGRTK